MPEMGTRFSCFIGFIRRRAQYAVRVEQNPKQGLSIILTLARLEGVSPKGGGDPLAKDHQVPHVTKAMRSMADRKYAFPRGGVPERWSRCKVLGAI